MRRPPRRVFPWTLAGVLAVLAAPAAGAQDAAGGSAKKAPGFEAAADLPTALAGALARAKRDNQRVLAVLGKEKDEGSIRLAALLREDPKVKRKVLYEYRVVKVDGGARDANRELALRLGADLEKVPLPFLSVLGADGKVLATEDPAALRDGARLDPGKVLAFLERWQAAPRDARALLKGALEEAARTERKVLVHLGAPW